jgi:chromosome segregation ATPase
VELDSFTKVKEAIDNMVADLKKEQEDEVKTKAYCVKEFNLNEKNTYHKTDEKENLESKLELLAATIEQLTNDLEAAKQQIADAQLEIKKASEDREKANAEFQTIVADQRATQGILKKAITRLEWFYKTKESKPSFLQKAARTAQTPPVKFQPYNKNAGSVSVISFLEQIVEDSHKLESEAMAGETKAQATYETFVKGSNKVIASLQEEVSDKTKLVASAEVDTEEAKSDHASAVEVLAFLEKSLAYLHKECDYLLKNFDLRQKARLEEIEAIQKAKAILSGME